MEWNRIDSPEIDQNNHTTLVHDKDGILNHQGKDELLINGSGITGLPFGKR